MEREVVIDVDRLSKRYRLGVIGGATLSDELQVLVAKLRGRPNPLVPIGAEVDEQQVGQYFWALRDIDIQVRQGEVLGIIGRNGAGKSTLLKLLSRITSPTGGRIRMKGRVSSLLEVGTGFNPELTGRENVYLNGAILGMSRREIGSKLDAIVAFSGIKHHIDTPTKRYSSGMKVRLGFAVAAHLEPEIPIIDEVLAVGDAEFQRKCLGKMKDVAQSGRTILFVSHNMVSVRSLCDRVVWLEGGRVRESGATEEVVHNYLKAYSTSGSRRVWDPSNAPGNEHIKLLSVSVRGPDGEEVLQRDRPLVVEIVLDNLGYEDGAVNVGIHLLSEDDSVLFGSSMAESVPQQVRVPIGRQAFVCRVPPRLLNAGEFKITVNAFRSGKLLFRAADSVQFEVNDEARTGSYFKRRPGYFRPDLVWSTRPYDSSSLTGS